MDGTFEEYKPGWYEVEFSQEDDFRNKDKTPAEKAKFGLAYAVKFAGDAGTYYWSSRTVPVDGEKYFGHVEPSSTGKSMNFRKDTPPDGMQPTNASTDNKQSQESQDSKSDGITASMAFKLAYHGFIQTEQIQPRDPEHWAFVKEQGRQIFHGIKDIMNSQPDGGSPESVVHPASPQIKVEKQTPATTSLGDKFRARNVEDGMTAGEPDIPEDLFDDR